MSIGLVIMTSWLDIFYKWIFDHLVDHIDHSISTTESDIDILMMMWKEEKVGDGMIDDCLIIIGLE